MLPQLLDTVRSTMMVIVAALFIIAFLVQPFRIPSESMERTLLVGDFLLVDKVAFAPAGIWGGFCPIASVTHHDIVVFHFPLDSDEHVVKRVIGVPGDEVAMQNGVAVVNDAPQPEPYDVFERAGGDEYRDQFPRYTTEDPGVDPHWRVQMRGLVENAHLRVPPTPTSCSAIIATTAATAATGASFRAKTSKARPCLSTFLCASARRPIPLPLPGDRLGNSVEDRLIDFARWDRILRIVH